MSLKTCALVLTFISHANAAPSLSRYDEASRCIVALWKDHAWSPTEARRCRELAKPFAFDKSLRGRAIYLMSLNWVEGTPKRDILNYFDTNLKADLTSAVIQAADGPMLGDLFYAIDDVAFYSKLPEAAQLLHSIQTEMARRNISVEENVVKCFRRLVTARLFAEAKALKESHPSGDMETLPEIHDLKSLNDTEPGYYEISADGRSLDLKKFKFDQGPQVIMVASPDCHFCENAIPVLESDEHIRNAWRSHGIVLYPQGDLNLSELSGWTARYSAFKIFPVFKDSAWKDIDFSSTPRFYFLKAGKVVGMTIGWDPKVTRLEIDKKLKAIGL
jgi:hypothetical protein